MANNSIKGITVEIGGDTTKLGKALESVNQKGKSLSSELGQINKLLKLDPTNTQLLAQKQEVLSKAITNTGDKLAKLKEAEAQVQKQFEKGEASEEQVRALQREIIATEGKLNSYEKAAEETAKATKGMGDETEKAGEKAEDGGKKFEKFGAVAKKAAAAIGAAFAAVGAAAVAAGKKLFDLSKETAEAGDTIDKSSQKIGLSAEAYQEWDYVLSQNGADINQLGAGMKTLTKQISSATNGGKDAAENFARLGISMNDLKTLSREEIFSKVVSGMQGMADTTDRAALANTLFGKSGQQLAPLLNQTAESTQALKDQAHELGMVMSQDAVSASVAFQDSLDTLQRTFTGVKNNLVGELLPGITQVMQGLSGILAGQDGAMEKVQSGMASTVDVLQKDVFPKVTDILLTLIGAVAEIAPSLIETLVNGIVNNMPKLVAQASKIIVTFSNALTKNLPAIVKGGLQLIVSLVKGIVDALPMIVDSIVGVLDAIITGLDENLGTLITALVDGIGKILPPLVEAIPKLIMGLIDAVLNNLPAIIQGIIQLVLMIVQNVGKFIQALIPMIPTIITKVVQAITDCLPLLLDGIIDLIIVLITEVIPPLILEIAKALPQIIAAIVEGLGQLLATLVEWAGSLFARIGEWFANLGKNIWEWLKKVVVDVAKWGLEMQAKAKTAISGFFKNIIDKIAALPGDIWAWLKKTVVKVASWGLEMQTKAKTAIKDVVNGIIEKFKALPGKIKEVGKNLIQGLWKGISDAKDWVIKKIKGLADDLLGGIKDFFGVHSPSRKTAWIGQMLDKGLAQGIESFSDMPIDAAEAMADDVIDAAQNIDGMALNRQLQTRSELAVTNRFQDSGLLQKLDVIIGAIEAGQVISIDGKALVGATVDRYDTSLGQRRALAMRGAV